MRINDKTSEIGSKFKVTEQGYLVAKGSKISRVANLDYLGEEIGQRKGELYKVGVNDEALFNQQTIESFEGMPVTLIHPDELEVTADTWKEHSIGHAQNVRKEGGFLKADIYISDAKAIKEIQDKDIKEISLGYDCDLVVANSSNSDYLKTNIKGNHVAIVPSGRCGGSCRLGDKKGINMSKKTLLDGLKKVLGLLKVNDDGETVLSADETKQLQELLKNLQVQLEEMEALPEGQKDQVQIDALKVQIEELNKKLEVKASDTPPVADEGVNTDELKKKVVDLEKENTDLKAELEKLKGTNETTSALNDAKARFPKVKVGDASTARNIHGCVLIDSGVFTKDELVSKSDIEIKSAYAGLCAATKRNNPIGKALLNDSNKSEKKDFNKMFGGGK